MEYLKTAIDFVLHLGNHLPPLVERLGPWFYALMFLVVFCETGLVITPFLPGDSLLFALGALAGAGSLNLPLLMALLFVAALAGDFTNYNLGAWLGPRIFRGDKIRFLNPKHLERTHQFYEEYGGKTIVIARFVPIVRTFAPFVAGMGKMTWRYFIGYSVLAATLWVGIITPLGYYFGTREIVKRNFTLVIFGIIGVSLLPAIIEIWRVRRRNQAAKR